MRLVDLTKPGKVRTTFAIAGLISTAVITHDTSPPGEFSRWITGVLAFEALIFLHIFWGIRSIFSPEPKPRPKKKPRDSQMPAIDPQVTPFEPEVMDEIMRMVEEEEPGAEEALAQLTASIQMEQHNEQ